MNRKAGITLIGVLGMLLVTLIVIAIVVPDDKTSPPNSSGTAKTVTVTPNTKSSTATPWTDPLIAARAAYTPIKIVSSTMGLKTDIIPEGATSAGAMDTPICKSLTDPLCGQVYWWDVGVVPGQVGNAVFAAHVNRPDNSAGAFAYLSKMQIGDTVQTTATNGTILTFAVTKVETVSAYAQGSNNPVIVEIFGPASTANLNLITCTGDWDVHTHTFDHRFVVYTTLVGPSPFPKG